MIRYRQLYESENSDIKRYSVVRCAGYEWFVIGIDGDIVTLLAKDADFEIAMSNKRLIDYKTCEVRDYLVSDILPKLGSVNPIPVRLDDVGCVDKVWLLSIDDAKKLPKKVRRFNRWWWLRSLNHNSNFPAIVAPGGDICTYDDMCLTVNAAVRPAMRVRIEDLD